MICPQCKIGELKENINIGGFAFRRKKIISTYCPLCSFKNEVTFNLSYGDFIYETAKRETEAKTKKIVHDTTRNENIFWKK